MKEQYPLLVEPHLPEIAALLSAGASESAIAEKLAVSPRSLQRYRKKHPELAALFELRRAADDEQVENALLRRATGYEDSSGKPVPPDIRAAIFWLTNRRPDVWCKSAAEKGKKRKGKAVRICLSADEERL